LALLDVRDAREVLARRLSFRRRVTDVRPVLRAPLAASLRRVARRADVAIADLAPLDLVRREKIRTAPSAQRRLELPRQIDRVADARVHAEPAGRNDEMHRVAGKEHAAGAITIGEQQILFPFADIQHLISDWNPNRPL